MTIRLITFDVDGTLLTTEMQNEGQYVKGIIPTFILKELESNGINIALVSPSPYGPEAYRNDKHWFCRNGSNDYRWENIVDAQLHFGATNDETIYVDDIEGNRLKIEKELNGIKTYSPEKFMDIYWTLKNV